MVIRGLWVVVVIWVSLASKMRAEKRKLVSGWCWLVVGAGWQVGIWVSLASTLKRRRWLVVDNGLLWVVGGR